MINQLWIVWWIIIPSIGFQLDDFRSYRCSLVAGYPLGCPGSHPTLLDVGLHGSSARDPDLRQLVEDFDPLQAQPPWQLKDVLAGVRVEACFGFVPGHYSSLQAQIVHSHLHSPPWLCSTPSIDSGVSRVVNREAVKLRREAFWRPSPKWHESRAVEGAKRHRVAADSSAAAKAAAMPEFYNIGTPTSNSGGHISEAVLQWVPFWPTSRVQILSRMPPNVGRLLEGHPAVVALPAVHFISFHKLQDPTVDCLGQVPPTWARR